MKGRQGKNGDCRKIVAGGWARGGGDHVCEVPPPTRWCCLHLHISRRGSQSQRANGGVSLHLLRRG